MRCCLALAFCLLFLSYSSARAEGAEIHFSYNGSLDGPIAKQNVANLITNMLITKQFDQIDKTLSEWNDPQQRMTDGDWKISVFSEGVKNLMIYSNDWDGAYKTLEEWRQKASQSPGLALAEAVYWNSYAWNARGHGYANSVTTEGLKLFRERLEKAEKVLLDSKGYASQYPTWYHIYLNVENSLGRDKEDVYKIFQESISKHPDYIQNYYFMLRAFEPKWGGSWDLVDHFIMDQAGKRTAEDSDILYARLYWFSDLGEEPQFNLFRSTSVSWPRMKKGFNAIMKAYPESKWNLNNYASFACRAGDNETYQVVRTKIGKDIFPDAWRTNYSADVCDHQFGTTL